MKPPVLRRKAAPARGVLAKGEPEGLIAHQRILPAPALSPWVAHFWSVQWNLRASFHAETLPHPCVHVVFEESGGTRRAELAGVPTERFRRELSGTGWVFGIKFRPAVLPPRTGEVVALSDLFGSAATAWADAIFAQATMAGRIDAAEQFLSNITQPLPPDVVSLRDLVEQMASDHSLVQVEEVAKRAGMDKRTLQRRFRREVGVSPKWVIQRYRLHEAAARLSAPNPPALADLSASLGYADQAHFTRDFKRTVGRAPGGYRRGSGHPETVVKDR